MANNMDRMLQAQFNFAVKQPNEFVKYYMSDDLTIWYCLLYNFDGNDNEFEGGEYLVRIVVNKETGFPYNPPHFYFMTPNGVYGVEKKVCISIGEFHKDNYISALKVSGFVDQLWNGMIGWKSLGDGISILHTSAEEKKQFAAASRAYNREHYPELIARIESAYCAYSDKWDKSKIPEPMLKRLGLNK